jgi:mono/diheme cytochrome c family protein
LIKRTIGSLALVCVPAMAQQAESFTPQQINTGADIYARNCSPCHGARMLDPQGAFDLRKFPRNERERFVNAVVRGKNQMPPWGDLLKPGELEALWAYVAEGEKKEALQALIAQRDPQRARRARRYELLRARRGRIESAAGPGKEVAAQHAEALVTPVEEIVHLERDFPLAAHAVAGECLRDAVTGNGAMEVAVVFVAA